MFASNGDWKPFASELCQSQDSIHWMDIGLKERRKKLDVQKKSLKRWSTLVCIFSYIEEEKFTNEIKVNKVHKICHYN